MTFPTLRKRTPSEPVVLADLSAAHGTVGVLPAPPIPTRNTKSGALSRIMSGVFGAPNPESYSASEQVRVPSKDAFYHFHEGDLFTPGTGNYVFEPTLENPLQTIWGISFLRKPNTFNPEQPPQVYSGPNVVINGIGGQVSGQIAFQPIESAGV